MTITMSQMFRPPIVLTMMETSIARQAIDSFARETCYFHSYSSWSNGQSVVDTYSCKAKPCGCFQYNCFRQLQSTNEFVLPSSSSSSLASNQQRPQQTVASVGRCDNNCAEVNVPMHFISTQPVRQVRSLVISDELDKGSLRKEVQRTGGVVEAGRKFLNQVQVQKEILLVSEKSKHTDKILLSCDINNVDLKNLLHTQLSLITDASLFSSIDDIDRQSWNNNHKHLSIDELSDQRGECKGTQQVVSSECLSLLSQKYHQEDKVACQSVQLTCNQQVVTSGTSVQAINRSVSSRLIGRRPPLHLPALDAHETMTNILNSSAEVSAMQYDGSSLSQVQRILPTPTISRTNSQIRESQSREPEYVDQRLQQQQRHRYDRPQVSERRRSFNRLHLLRSRLDFSPLLSVHVPIATNIEHPGSAYAELEPKRRLWQSLVVPMLLGSLIFLTAMSTKHISIVLSDDRILMILALVIIFIVMSGLAFWLSSTFHNLATNVADRNSNTNQNDCTTETTNSTGRSNSLSSDSSDDRHNHRDLSHYRNFWSRRNETGVLIQPSQSSSAYSQETLRQQHSSSCRCSQCPTMPSDTTGIDSKTSHGISFIDCKPPDYYSAMRNSSPVDIVIRKAERVNQAKESATPKYFRAKSVGLIDPSELFPQQMSPPKYEELPISWREINQDNRNNDR